jgi:hypothetical protein
VSPVKYELGFYIPEDDILQVARRRKRKLCPETYFYQIRVRQRRMDDVILSLLSRYADRYLADLGLLRALYPAGGQTRPHSRDC